ncbi:hypothetical protein BH09PSE5_BH09PSE5_10720 [soil metagenome]
MQQSQVRGQRGVAVLAVTMIVLLAMTMTAVFVSRSLLFEQRSASNQYRSVKAFEAAEAGMEWATAMLNDASPRGDDCLPAPGFPTLRQRFLQPASDAYGPSSTARPTCSIGGGSLQCQCDASSIAGAAGAPSDGWTAAPLNDDARFTLVFQSVAGDSQSVLVTSHGCTNAAAVCGPQASADALQAVAKVAATFKLRTALAPVSTGLAPTSTGAGPVAASNAVASAPGLVDANAGVLVRVPDSWHDVKADDES